MTNHGTAAERVARGVEWLDSNVPGWVDKVEINELNMGSSCRCVLGQVFGNDNEYEMTGYGYALATQNNLHPEHLGFDFSPEDVVEIEESRNPRPLYGLYAPLQQEWERVIAERKANS